MLRDAVAVTALLGCLGTCAWAQVPEPISLGQKIAGSVEANYDQKRYELEVPAGRHLYVVCDAKDDAELDFSMAFGSLTQGELVGERVTFHPQAIFEVPKTQEGRYFLVVQGAMSGDHGGFEFCVYDGWPFSRMSLGETATGSVDRNYDAGYYELFLPAGLHLYVTLKAVDGAQLTLSMLNGTLTRGELVAELDAFRPEVTKEVAKTNDLPYYLVVEGMTSSDKGSYSIVIQTDNLPGDLNGDSRLGIADVVAALQVVAGVIKPNSRQLAAIDLNHNGKADITDVVAILRKVVGL